MINLNMKQSKSTNVKLFFQTHLEELKANLKAALMEGNDLKQQMKDIMVEWECSEQYYLGMREKSKKLKAKILMRNKQIDALKTEKKESEVITTNLRGIRERKVFFLYHFSSFSLFYLTRFMSCFENDLFLSFPGKEIIGIGLLL